MKTFRIRAAQGEVTIERIGDLPASRELPKGYRYVAPRDGKYVIEHSETGHDHVISADGATVGELEAPPAGMRILYAIVENPMILTHLRPYDTHERLCGEPGVYEFRINREFDHYAELGRLQID